MSNYYNEHITEKFPELITEIYNYVLSRIYKDNARIIDISLDDEYKKNITHYIDNKLTLNFIFNILYTLDGENKLDLQIKVPRMINGVFVINGKIKTPVYLLDKEYTLKYYKNKFIFNHSLKYFYDTDTVIKINEEKEEVSYTIEEFHDLKEFITDEKLCTRLCIKLDIPTQIPIHISKPLLLSIKDKFNEDTASFYDDFFLDKKIKTVQKSLLEHISLNKRNINFSDIGKLSRFKKLYNTQIQKHIKSHFNSDSKSYLSIQVPTKINSMNFISSINRVIMNTSISLYDPSFTDIIDPSRTPENKNINRINELNVCAHIDKESEIHIDIYDLNFNSARLIYYKYYDSKIITYDSVNYITRKIIPDKNNKVKYKYRGKYLYVDYKNLDKEGFLFIDSHPDDKLSVSSRNIPMINNTDSVRIGMGTSMVNQAIELNSPEIPLVATGAEDGSYHPLNIYAVRDGKVKSIKENIITTYFKNKEDKYTLSTIQSINKLNVTRNIKVKCGDIVKKGDLLAYPRIFDGSYKLGLNVFIAFMAYGNTFEDGVIVSDDILDKFSHTSIFDLDVILDDENTLISTPGVGVKLKARDKILSYTIKISKENLYKMIDKNNSFRDPYKEMLVPNNISEGYISDIKVIKGGIPTTVEEDITINKMLDTLESSMGMIKDKFSPVYYNDKLSESSHLSHETFKYHIKVKILVNNKLKIGDKVTNRYGSKGLISQIIPKDKMPKTKDGKSVEMILNPYTTIARKNLSQLLEINLSNISIKLFDKISKMLKEKNINYSLIRNMLSEIIDPKIELFSNQELIKFHNNSNGRYNINVGCHTKNLTDRIKKYYKNIDIPHSGEFLYDGNNGRKIRNPIITGYMYIMKLYHLPEFSSKINTENSRIDPLLGGTLRDTGQTFGELELWALLSNNLTSYIEENRKINEEYVRGNLLSNFLSLGFNIKYEDGTTLDIGFNKDIEKLKKKYNMKK